MSQDAATGEMSVVEAIKVPALKEKGHCVLFVGQILDVEGGRFRVKSIGKRMMMLEGMPATEIDNLKPLEKMANAQKAAGVLMAQRNQISQLIIALLMAHGGAHEITTDELKAVTSGYRFQTTPREDGKAIMLSVMAPPEPRSSAPANLSALQVQPEPAPVEAEGAD